MWADSFVNPGFEAGSFSGWTIGGGTWEENSSTGAVTYTPNASVGEAKSGVVTGSGTDANTGGVLQEVFAGSHAARVNNSDSNYHYSTISQQVANWTNDPLNGNKLYFSWAAVLEEPSNEHPESAAPHFEISVFDNSHGTSLYDVAFNVYDASQFGVGWHTGASSGSGNWMYSYWVPVALDMSSASGDNITLSVSAYDCGWGGHGGYAYVDAFGTAPTQPNEGVLYQGTIDGSSSGGTPEASPLVLLGACLPFAAAYRHKRRRRKE